MPNSEKNNGKNIIPGMAVMSILAVLSFVYYFFYEYNSLIFDDAFITYRYALNFARGNGFVYNAGENVYGTTTLLYAFYLGIYSFFTNTGSMHIFSQLSSIVFFNASLILLLVKCRINPFLLAAVYLNLFFNEYVYYSLFSGMETAFVIFLLLLLTLYREKMSVYFLLPFLILARIDTAFVFISAFVLFSLIGVLRESKTIKDFIKETLLVAAGALIAFTISYLIFGTVIPNTILAKDVIYKNSVFDQSLWYRFNLMRNFGYPSLISIPVVLFAVASLVYSMKKKRIRGNTVLFLILFSLFYFMFEVLAVTRINLWYIPVLTFAVMVFLTLIINENSRLLKYSVIVLAAAVVFNIYSNRKIGSVIFADHRNNLLNSELYEVSTKIKPGSKIFCGDIGVIGFFCPDSYIYDYSGLVTPRAVGHNKIKRDYGEKGVTTDYAEILKQIDELNPEYVNFRDYPFYPFVKNDTAFSSKYGIVFRGREENLYSRK